MPRLAVLTVRASFVHLIIGTSLGAFLLTTKATGLWPVVWAWLPAHVETMLVGWLVQFALGVAFWILPRFGGQRGSVPLAWLAIVLLNAGVVLSGLAPYLRASQPALAGRLLSLAAIGAFALHAWPRIKAPGAPG
jgi:hypothetical protein